MNLRSVSARRGSLRVLASLVGLAIVCAAVTPAEARRGHHRRVHRTHHAVAAYQPAFAAIVVDAKTGKVLHAQNEDALRHPASITKVMTLYLLFEQLDKGQLRLDSRIRVSARAAAQAPTKLGLRPGETISVEDAIKAVVTRSANDIAVTIAEAVGGSEPTFAEMMTRKARSLGMSRTVYVNASGLPDVEQVTTARDLAILARAIQERFPRYYPYFSIPSFTYAGKPIRNHNRLLGRVEGVDGIKTGFTRMSGFNLMTSAKSDGHHIVAIVLGGRSGAIRDRIMASLVEENLPRAYAGARTAPMIAEAPVSDQPLQNLAALSNRAGAAAGADTDSEEGDLDAPTSSVTQAQARNSAPARKTIDVANVRPVVASASGSLSTTTPSAFRWVSGPQARGASSGEEAPAQRLAYAAEPRAADVRTPEPRVLDPRGLQKARSDDSEAKSSVAKSDAKSDARAETKAEKTEAKSEAKSGAKLEMKAAPASGWIIQLGATEDEAKAKELLANARSAASMLNRASPFTEKVVKGGSTLWRARFSGFDTDTAQAACKTLKRNGFSCFATKI